MEDDIWESLGQLVRSLRERHGLTQDELGKRAGYGTGAGVSISRFESGQLRPGPDRVAGIAKALGLTSDELEAMASAQEQANDGDSADPTAPDTADGAIAPSAKAIKERVRRIQHEIDERTRMITDLGEAFNMQHARARDQFFMRFVEIGARVDGAPQPAMPPPDDDENPDADAVAAYRLRATANGVVQLLAGGAGGAAAGAAVGGAAAYGTFVAVAALGTASTGAAITGLSGVAATIATLAILGGGTLAAGGAGVAGGTLVLAGIVAAPAVVLAAGGLLWMVKRNRRQQQELAIKVAEAEAELNATRPGVDALTDLLPRATETLDYIATHAGHALNRWEQQVGGDAVSWDSLNSSDQQRYQDFIEVAAAQLAIVTINVQGLLTTRGEERDQLIDVANKVLDQSRDAVTARV